MKKTIMLFVAIAAMCGLAEPKRRIFLDNGETKLSLLNLAATSGEITGIECITANNSGTLKLEVGKQMDTRKKVTSYKQLYETNVVEHLEAYDYDYTIVLQYDGSSSDGDIHIVETNVYKRQSGLSSESFFPNGVFTENRILYDYGHSYSNFKFKVDQLPSPGGGHLSSWDFTFTRPEADGVIDCVHTQRYSTAEYIVKLTGLRSDPIPVYYYMTNTTHIGTITNVTWQPVKRTIYKELISTNLTGGINISHLAEPCDVFVGDSLKVTSPISNENPGKFGIILSY